MSLNTCRAGAWLLLLMLLPDAATAQSANARASTENQSYVVTKAANPDESVRRIVVFETPPLAVAGIGAGKRGLSAAAATASLDGERQRLRADLATMENAAGKRGAAPASEIYRDFRTVLNGVAIITTRHLADQISALPYVRKVYEDRPMYARADTEVHLMPAVGADSPRSSSGGSGIVVAIIDSGIDHTHPAFGGGFGPGHKVIGGYDFIDDDDSPMDENGHGTHVAGIVAGHDPAAGFMGLAPAANLLAYRVLDAGGMGPTSGIIAAIERAVDPDQNPVTPDGAHIINMSLGGEGHPDDPTAQAVDHATAMGVVVVVAAGNNGRSFSVDSPGSARSAITVGASDNADALAVFSSRGPVATSFENKPDVLAPGVAIVSALPGGAYAGLSGTSMAAPYVAGTAALLLEQHPGWEPATVKAALMLSAKDIGLHLWQQGSGRVDYEAATAIDATVEPASISFGNLDPDAHASFERSLLIRNLGSVARTFSITAQHSVPGAQVAVAPPSVQVGPGQFELVTVTTDFEPESVPFPQQIDVPYTGHLLVSSGQTDLRIQFSVTKTPQLVLEYDVPPDIVSILSDAGHVNRVIQPSDVVGFALPAGTYDIISEYNIPHGEMYARGALVNEQVVLSGKQGLALSRDQVSVPVTVEPVDRHGRPVPLDYAQFRLQHVSGYSSNNELGPVPIYYFSEMNGRFSLHVVAYSFSDPSGDDFVVPLYHAGGVHAPLALRNDPVALREVRTRYVAPPGATELFLVPENYMRISSSFMASYPVLVTEKAEHHRIFPPFERTVFYGSVANASFGYPYQAHTIYNTSQGGLPLYDGENVRRVYISPMLELLPEQINVYVPQDLSEPIRSISGMLHEEVFGMGPISFGGRMWNAPVRLGFDQRYRSALFFGQSGESVGGAVSYVLHRAGERAGEGMFSNDLLPQIPLEQSEESFVLRLSFDDVFVDDRPAHAEVALTFDTRGRPGQTYDPDPPYVGALMLMSDGAMTDAIDPSAESAIVAVIRDVPDHGDLLPRATSTGGIRVRRLGEVDWTELATTRDSETFTAAWPPDAAPGYYGIRVDAEDVASHTLEYTLEPGFRVGFAEGNTAPTASRLTAPADDIEVHLDTLRHAIRFAWEASEDPEPDQQIRYVFRMSGEGLDTTIATSATETYVDLVGRLMPDVSYTWTVASTDGFALVPAEAGRNIRTTSVILDAEKEGGDVPRAYVLDQNYPNPFNPTTAIRFGLPTAGDVRLEAFDVLGRRVAIIAEGFHGAGYHTHHWTPTDLPSGRYLVRLRTEETSLTHMVTLLK